MKTVLILAYYFPPLGMGGTQRVAKFVKYLPRFGWQPVVVTVKDIAYYAKDESMLDELRAVRIYRTGSLDPHRVLHKLSRGQSDRSPVGERRRGLAGTRLYRLLSWTTIPDSKKLWLPFAFMQVRKLLKNEACDCLLTTSPPHSVHLLGYWLQRIYRLPWVADFRDGWSGGNFQYEPTFVHRWLNRRLERLVLRNADRVITVSEPLTEKMRQKAGPGDGRFQTITNGFDAADFPGKTRQTRGEKFTVTYSGTLSPIAPLESFLIALSQLLRAQPELSNKVVVNLVGLDLDGRVSVAVRELSLAKHVRLVGYCEHQKAIAYLLQSDLLLYPVADWASDDFVPGKTFEYMAAGKPVLAIGPEVEGVRLLRQTNAVLHAGHQEVGALVQIIRDLICTRQKPVRPARRDKVVRMYTREALTGRLSQILNGCTE